MLDFEWLLKPYDKRAFIDGVWQQRPALLATGRTGYFETLFSRRALERIIEFSQPRPPSILLASVASSSRAEVPLLATGRINIDQIRRLYVQGKTVVLNSVEGYDPVVAQLARAIETEMCARVQVNSYLTPPSAQGFRPHYDTHDVLVAQIEGDKIWKVYDRDAVCPLTEMVDGDRTFRKSSKPPDEIHLRSGDLLYVPRGWVHEAATDQAASLHLTISIYPPLGRDLLQAALDALVDRHPELREALPVGPLDGEAQRGYLEARFAQLVALFARHASAADAAHRIDGDLLRHGRCGGDGHLFEDAERLPHIGKETVLRRRTNVRCRTVKLDDGVGLQFLNGLIKAPAGFEAAMSFVAASIEPFATMDLPGLSTEQQTVLASSLVMDGLCYIVRLRQ